MAFAQSFRPLDHVRSGFARLPARFLLVALFFFLGGSAGFTGGGLFEGIILRWKSRFCQVLLAHVGKQRRGEEN